MKAIFLDRDGTIIVEPPNERLTYVGDIAFFPETMPALKLLQEHGFSLIMVTNQAGVGEGLITLEEFQNLEDELQRNLAEAGITFTKVFVCPHAASQDCDCRKPKPKLILDAAKEFGVDLVNSFMVGDNLSDIEAGINAGTKTILVKTGIRDIEATQATFTAKDLLEAAEYVVSHS
jgi:D-glycero-D-manno-heptose 1,7-bisphosphate phosphatase